MCALIDLISTSVRRKRVEGESGRGGGEEGGGGNEEGKRSGSGRRRKKRKRTSKGPASA